MTQSYYGGFLGNAGALNDLAYRGGSFNPETLPYQGGGMGVTPLAGGVDLPFGGGGRYKTIQEQYKPGAPKENIPIRVFPESEPGREGAINVPFRLAQAYPGMQAIGNAAGLGGMMKMGPKFGPRPFNLDINAEDDYLKSVGASANFQIDPNQALRVGGSFNPGRTDEMGVPVPQSYSVYGAYETPGIGINATYTNTGRNRGGGMPGMGGFPGQINASFKGRF